MADKPASRYMWNGAGSSTDPCDETYRGSSAGDTPENKALVSQMQSVAKTQKIALYIDFHSYSQDILTPYGYTCNVLPANSASQVSLGQKAAAAIRSVHGTQYTVGPTCQTLYATAGGSNDYAQDVASAQYAVSCLRPLTLTMLSNMIEVCDRTQGYRKVWLRLTSKSDSPQRGRDAGRHQGGVGRSLSVRKSMMMKPGGM